MNPNQSFFYAVLFLVTSLFILTFLLYGRIRRKPLIGDYKPGTPDYKVFLGVVTNTKYLIVTIVATLLLTVNLLFSIQGVLRAPTSHSILIVAPVMVVGGGSASSRHNT